MCRGVSGVIGACDLQVALGELVRAFRACAGDYGSSVVGDLRDDAVMGAVQPGLHGLTVNHVA